METDSDNQSQRSNSPDDWILLNNESDSSNMETDSDEVEILISENIVEEERPKTERHLKEPITTELEIQKKGPITAKPEIQIKEAITVEPEIQKTEPITEIIEHNSTVNLGLRANDGELDDDYEYIKEEDEKTDSFSILSFCEDLWVDIDLVSRIRSYTHKRNTKVNKMLDISVMLTLAMATGLGVGNFLGKTSTCPPQQSQPLEVSSALQLYTLNNSPAMMLKSVAKDKLYFMLNSEQGVKKVTDPNPQRLNYNWNLIHFEFNSSLEPHMQCTQAPTKSAPENMEKKVMKDSEKSNLAKSEINNPEKPDINNPAILETKYLIGPENKNETNCIQTPTVTTISYYTEIYPNMIKMNGSSPNDGKDINHPKQGIKVEEVKSEADPALKHVKKSNVFNNGIPDISYQLLNSLKYSIKGIIEQTQDLILPKALNDGSFQITDVRTKTVKQMFNIYLKSMENKLDQLHRFSVSENIKHDKNLKKSFNRMIHVITRSVDEMLQKVLNVNVKKNRRHPNYRLKKISDKGFNVIENFERKWLESRNIQVRETKKDRNKKIDAKQADPDVQKQRERKIYKGKNKLQKDKIKDFARSKLQKDYISKRF